MAAAWTRLPLPNPCYLSRVLRSHRLSPDLRSSFRPNPDFRSCFRSVSGLRSNNSIHATTKIEEERLPGYSHNDHFPLQLGDKLKERYRVLGKLGYGSSSTVWFALDLESGRYAALKLYTQSRTQVNRELEIYQRLSTANKSHVGRQYVRTILDSFEVSGPRGHHCCLVHEPLCMSLSNLQSPGSKLTEDLLRGILTYIFLALDYLHNECHVIHTDIKASNILHRIEDESILRDYEMAEELSPSARKYNGNRFIYVSRNLGSLKIGHPVLCDFGEARYGDAENDDDIQPEVYRAPEVILEMKWSYSVDIWNVGVMDESFSSVCIIDPFEGQHSSVWDLLGDKHLFNGLDKDGNYSSRHHLAEMIAYLGPPPASFLRRSAVSSEYFDVDGHWNEVIAVPKALSLEQSERNLVKENKHDFSRFVHSMLKWMPEERKTPRELLDDPWLNKWRE